MPDHANATTPDVDRDRPTPEFIEALRARYPMEREIDWAFTRRMQRRAQGPFRAPDLQELVGSLRKLLDAKLQGGYEISNPAWLGGGGSKLQMRFTLRTEQPLFGHTERVLVLRMEPAESLNPSSRLREHQIIEALAGVLPVPQMYWVDRDGTWFPEPALVYSFSTGVAKPSSFQVTRVTGIGTNYGPRLRRKLGLQFVQHLATLHNFDPGRGDFSSFDLPRVGSTEAALWQVNRAVRGWEEDRPEPMPLMEVARGWLQAHLPELDRVSLIHGDYRCGNFLFDEDSGDITAILDWERCTIGDRHRDLAWATSEAVGHYDESGQHLLVCGLLPLQEFLDEYRRASGLVVDPARLRFYTVLSRYQQAVTVLGTGYRVVRLRRSHQDILLARIECAAYVLLEELRLALADALAAESKGGSHV